MIVCPDCKIVMQSEKTQLQCPNCLFQPTELKGILCFSPEETDGDSHDYKTEGLDLLYKYEQEHFWFIHRRRLIHGVFEKYVQKRERILEIGAGTGNIAIMLEREGYTLELGDINVRGLYYAGQYGLRRLYQFDARRIPFKEEYDTVCMFDVLEHIEEDRLVIKNIHQSLKSDGKFILTVPAHKSLWGSNDVVSGHKRRYELRRLKQLLAKSGFDILAGRYVFICLPPFLLLRNFLNRKKEHSDSFKDLTLGLDIHEWINMTLNALFRIERQMFSRWFPPFGASILLVARKVGKSVLSP